MTSPYLRFLLIFCILYFGTYFMIGLAAPGGLYSPFVEHYLDYVSWLRSSILYGAGILTKVMGHATQIEPDFTLRVIGGKHVIIAYDCAGYGVLSFWLAYVYAVKNSTWKRKVLWGLGGAMLLWLINCFRIALYLLARNSILTFPFKMDHHLLFNIMAYMMIAILIILHERMVRNQQKQDSE